MNATISHAFLATAIFLPDCLQLTYAKEEKKNENRNGVVRWNRSEERCFRVGKFNQEMEAAAKTRAA